MQAVGRRTKHVLDTVRSGVTVTQHSDAEVVQPIGVPVLDTRKNSASPATSQSGSAVTKTLPADGQ